MLTTTDIEDQERRRREDAAFVLDILFRIHTDRLLPPDQYEQLLDELGL
jgi:hypothetical protein